MKSQEYDQLIIQNMIHLNELTHIDIYWLSESYDKVHAFVNNRIPLGLDFHSDDYVKIEALCYREDCPRYCIASTLGHLEFIFIPLVFKKQKKGLIRIGPFITNPMTSKILSRLAVSLNLTLRQHQSLRSFYDGLLIVSSHFNDNIGHIGMNLFGHQLPQIQRTEYHTEQLLLKPISVSMDDDDERNLIESRYAYEKLIRKAVSAGNLEELQKARTLFYSLAPFDDRFPENPLRSAKNLTIVSNTILRISAGNGGLHPIYLHQISDKYARLIENADTHSQLNQINNLMYKEYTETVKLHAFPNVSPLIRKVIDTIHLNLDQSLSVSILAKSLGLKPSNLANQFKKETDHTVSEFINKMRIQESLYYLDHSENSIGEVGRLVGYHDQNYFTRVFKKYKGMSPNQYRHSTKS